jgi:hypothetical protein
MATFMGRLQKKLICSEKVFVLLFCFVYFFRFFFFGGTKKNRKCGKCQSCQNANFRLKSVTDKMAKKRADKQKVGLFWKKNVLLSCEKSILNLSRIDRVQLLFLSHDDCFHYIIPN